VVYVVKVGGDAFCCGRFFTAILPLCAIFAGALSVELAGAAVRWTRSLTVGVGPGLAAAAALGLMTAGLGYQMAISLPSLRAAGAPLYESFAAVCLAETLRNPRPRRSMLIGIYQAGTLPYFLPEYRFHDFLGKSDWHIAHSQAHAGPPWAQQVGLPYSLGRVWPDLIVTAVSFADADEARYRAQAGADWGFNPALGSIPSFRRTIARDGSCPPRRAVSSAAGRRTGSMRALDSPPQLSACLMACAPRGRGEPPRPQYRQIDALP
jgi:hypothetical protein